MLYPGRTETDLDPPGVNHTNGDVIRPPNGMVLHIAQGSFAGTVNWQHNPVARVSSYLVFAGDGRVAQVVDFDDRAWTESDGNSRWIGCEFEGAVPAPLTASQVLEAGRFYAWGVQTWGWPLASTDDVNGRGLGWHGMGGAAWGGHPDCPGAAVVAQRPAILATAAAVLHPDNTGGFDVPADPQVIALLTQIRDNTANLLSDEENFSRPNNGLATIDGHIQAGNAILRQIANKS